MKRTEANRLDPDQKPQSAASDQDLHCLLTGILIKKKGQPETSNENWTPQFAGIQESTTAA